jgi:hypothetical protein
VTELATVPPSDDGIFDATQYDLPIPRIDGRKADKLTLSIGGTLELDRTNEEDLTLLENLRIGQDIDLHVTATVAAKGFTHASKGDDHDQVGYQIRLRVHSYESTSAI